MDCLSAFSDSKMTNNCHAEDKSVVTAAIRFEDHIGLVRLQARQGYKWACGAGLLLSFDDMYQEASVAFLLAAKGFDPDKGVKFSAYYTMAAFSQFRKLIGIMSGVKNLNPAQRKAIADRKAENELLAAVGGCALPATAFGLRPKLFSEMDGDYESANFEESLVSDALSPESILENRQERQDALRRLKPLSRLIVEWLQDPPEALIRELTCQTAHRERFDAASIKPAMLQEGITVKDIGRFMQMVDPSLTNEELREVDLELTSIERKYKARIVAQKKRELA